VLDVEGLEVFYGRVRALSRVSLQLKRGEAVTIVGANGVGKTTLLRAIAGLIPVRGGSMGEPQVTERIVNQLLAEMDGMVELKGVVVLGATNRPDMIDPALLRPGRFDEIVYVPIPDAKARLEILRSHTRKMALDRDVDLKKLVEITDRFTGADIAGVCMKAGLFALRDNPNARSVTMEHFFRAVKEEIPSVTDELIKEYEKLARKVKQESVRIGFARGG